MKKLILTLLMAVAMITVNSQSCIPPECSKSFTLFHSYSTSQINGFNSNGFNSGTMCFEGDGSIATLPNTFNISNINVFIFNSSEVRYDVKQTVNMQNKTKMYINGGANVTLDKLSMNGGDTIFVSGNLIVKNVTNVNNSVSGNRATIVLNGGNIVIGNRQYLPGENYQSTGNVSNQISIVNGCMIVTPVRFGTIKVKIKN